MFVERSPYSVVFFFFCSPARKWLQNHLAVKIPTLRGGFLGFVDLSFGGVRISPSLRFGGPSVDPFKGRYRKNEVAQSELYSFFRLSNVARN